MACTCLRVPGCMGKASPCPALVPEAACGPGAHRWVQGLGLALRRKAPLGNLLQEAGCGLSLPLEKAGLLGEDSSCPALLQEAAPVQACCPGRASPSGRDSPCGSMLVQVSQCLPFLNPSFWSDGRCSHPLVRHLGSLSGFLYFPFVYLFPQSVFVPFLMLTINFF